MNKKIIIVIFFFLLLTGYFFLGSLIGTTKLSFDFLSVEKRQIIKKIVFPFRLINQQENIISDLYKDITQQETNISKLPLFEIELDFKKRHQEILITKLEDIKLSKNITMSKYVFDNGFFSGILGKIPGGYMDFHGNNLIVLSSRGILAYNENIDSEKNFKQIKNNINDFVGLEQFKKIESISVRDLFISNNKFFFSYVEEFKENCFNTSVAYGDMNYENINFKKLFSSEECVYLEPKNYSYIYQSGGRIVDFDESHILLSVGDYREKPLPQDNKTINGKIIKINIKSAEYEVISKGHRNPQGLYFDKESEIILATEHGPLGGDEVNLIDIKKIKKNNTLNFGWPIASAGEHYCKINRKDKNECDAIYKISPLYKSHKDHGFIEPLNSFVPSIGISEIVKIKDKRYVFGAMGDKRIGDKSLYFFELDNDNKFKNLKKIKVFQRIRDLNFNNGKLYLFFERPSSIGVISLN